MNENDHVTEIDQTPGKEKSPEEAQANHKPETHQSAANQVGRPPDPAGLVIDIHPVLTRLIKLLSVFSALLLAFFAFYQTADTRINGATNANRAELALFIAPCVIFVITTIVYYRFITDYTGEVAGLSVVGLFAAMVCCVKLSEAPLNDWAAHLRWMYLLFYSYIVWDNIMLAVCLPRALGAQNKIDKHMEEIAILSTHINQPTLVAILAMWFGAHYVGPEVASNYVAGVVAFHLVFATIACGRTMAFWLWKW
jgi:hypothetical protein